MNLTTIVIAGLAYFILGGIWFTPLFGKHWDKAVGFNRPPKWRPRLIYYLGPLIGCLVIACATGYIIHLLEQKTLLSVVTLGAILGIGFGFIITTINAISPNMPKPGLYSLITGSYHALGIVLCSIIIYYLTYA